MLFPQWSLQTKATLGVLVLVALALTVTAIGTITQATRQLVNEHVERARGVAAEMSIVSELAVYTGDTTELARVSDRSVSEGGIALIMFVDPAGNVLTGSAATTEAEVLMRRLDVGKPVDPARLVSFGTATIFAPSMEEGEFALLELDGAVASDEPERIGRVIVGLSRDNLYAAIRGQRTTTLFLFLVVACATVPAVSMLVRRWTRRLDQVATASERIAEGDLESTIKDMGRDEIGRLAAAFNEMREAIALRDQEMRRFNDTLQDEVRRRTEELERAMIAAEAASKAKSDFLANMSHEIRTPMTAIIGYAELLLDPDQNEEERADCVATICRSGKHLLDVINDILDVSKIEAGQMTVEKTACSPRQILDDVMLLMRDRAGTKGLGLELEWEQPPPERIQSDPTRLRQILVNLVGNAVKFTERGGVRLRCRIRTEDSESRLEVDVVDTGPGIPPSQLSRLFKPFSQVDETMARRHGGTGLGLAISRRLAQLLGGDIVVSSLPGEGCTFTMHVATGPLDEASAEDLPSAIPVHRPTATFNGRVLLAEDGVDNQRLISFLLRKAGAEVELADNGRIAFDKALAARDAGRPYDVILMDMQMPEMDGYTAARLLRDERYDMPIIALTAHAMAADRQKCLDAGCDDYMTKPVDRNGLIAMCASWQGRRSAA